MKKSNVTRYRFWKDGSISGAMEHYGQEVTTEYANDKIDGMYISNLVFDYENGSGWTLYVYCEEN